jgi:hypothetical protein
MFDNTAEAACVKAVRAALARTLADRENLPFAREELAGQNGIQGRPHVTLVNFGPLGYPMGDSLLPLAEMWERTPDEPPSEFGITMLDEAMDDARAELYDRLLNPSPAFALNAGVTDNPVLNRKYGEILRRSARFAGHVASDSPDVRAARAFLFPEDAQGNSTESAAFLRYKDFEARVEDLLLEAEEARHEGRAERADLLALKLTRVEVEWREIGRKAEVESALAVLEAADRDAGFEDERNRFLRVLEARTRKRLASALDYALVAISPLAPLIDPDAQGHWSGSVARISARRWTRTPGRCSSSPRTRSPRRWRLWSRHTSPTPRSC